MKKSDAIALLGGTVAAASKAIGISSAAVSLWPDELPPRIADRVQAALWRESQCLPSADADTSRATEPAQSHEAAARSAAFSTSHRGRILAALRMYGPMTAHEIAEHTSLSYVQIDRRMHELVKARQTRATGATRPTPTGGRAAVWEVV